MPHTVPPLQLSLGSVSTVPPSLASVRPLASMATVLFSFGVTKSRSHEVIPLMPPRKESSQLFQHPVDFGVAAEGEAGGEEVIRIAAI